MRRAIWKAFKWFVLYPLGFFMAIGICLSGPGAVSAVVCVAGLVLVFHNWGNRQLAAGKLDPVQTFEFEVDVTAKVEVSARNEAEAEEMIERFKADDALPKGIKVAGVSVT